MMQVTWGVLFHTNTHTSTSTSSPKQEVITYSNQAVRREGEKLEDNPSLNFNVYQKEGNQAGFQYIDNLHSG